VSTVVHAEPSVARRIRSLESAVAERDVRIRTLEAILHAAGMHPRLPPMVRRADV
jgi:endonuclease V-like protein UPF0215 family